MELAREHLAAYYALARGVRPAPHQVLILNKVQAFLERCWARPAAEHDTLQVLNINLPPGAGKSSIITATTPAWVVGKRPWERIGAISAKGDLATIFETVTKADIESGEVFRECFPDEDCRPDPSRGWARGALYLKGLPRREATPSIVTAGLFGSVLGKRFTFIVLDDPQDQESSRTPEQREKTWDFINGTVLSRAIPGSPIINVQQRWHEDDVSGHLERLYGAEALSVPAIRRDGRSYWPGMYSAGYLQQRRQADPHLFEANYQNRPGQGSGDVFRKEWLEKEYEGDPPTGAVFQSWDTALKTEQRNDFSAFIEGVVTPNRDVYLTDFDWRRVEFPDLVDWMKGEYRPKGRRPRPRLVLVEDKVSGTSAIQVLERNSAVPLKAVKPEVDKVSRARATTGWLEAGKVHFPKHHPRLAELRRFLLGFPLLSKDDPVDAFVQLLAYVIAHGPQNATALDATPH